MIRDDFYFDVFQVSYEIAMQIPTVESKIIFLWRESKFCNLFHWCDLETTIRCKKMNTNFRWEISQISKTIFTWDELWKTNKKKFIVNNFLKNIFIA